MTTETMTLILEKDMAEPTNLTPSEVNLFRTRLNTYERNKARLANLADNSVGLSVLGNLMPRIFPESPDEPVEDITNTIAFTVFFVNHGKLKAFSLAPFGDTVVNGITADAETGVVYAEQKYKVMEVNGEKMLVIRNNLEETLTDAQKVALENLFINARTVEEANEGIQTLFQQWFPNESRTDQFVTLITIPSQETVERIQTSAATFRLEPDTAVLRDNPIPTYEARQRNPGLESIAYPVTFRIDESGAIVATWANNAPITINGEEPDGTSAKLFVGDVIRFGNEGMAYEILVDDTNHAVLSVQSHPEYTVTLPRTVIPEYGLVNLSRSTIVVDGETNLAALDALWPTSVTNPLFIELPEELGETQRGGRPVVRRRKADIRLENGRESWLRAIVLPYPNEVEPALKANVWYRVKNQAGDVVGSVRRITANKFMVTYTREPEQSQTRSLPFLRPSLPDQLRTDHQRAVTTTRTSPNYAAVATTRRVGQMVHATGQINHTDENARRFGAAGTPVNWSIKLRESDIPYFDSLSETDRLNWVTRRIQEADEIVYAQHGYQADGRVYAKPMQEILLPYASEGRRQVGVAPSLMGANGTYINKQQYYYEDALQQSLHFYVALDEYFDFGHKRVTFIGQSTGARIVLELAGLLSEQQRLPKDVRFELVAPYLLGRKQLKIFEGGWGLGPLYGFVNNRNVWMQMRRTLLFLAKLPIFIVTSPDRVIVNNRLSGLTGNPAIADASIIHRENQQDVAYSTRWTDVILGVPALDWEALPEVVRLAPIRFHLPQRENIVDQKQTEDFIEEKNLRSQQGFAVVTYGEGHYPIDKDWQRVGAHLNGIAQTAQEPEAVQPMRRFGFEVELPRLVERGEDRQPQPTPGPGVHIGTKQQGTTRFAVPKKTLFSQFDVDHASVQPEGEGLTITNHSPKGTWINGVLLTVGESKTIAFGDEVVFGQNPNDPEETELWRYRVDMSPTGNVALVRFSPVAQDNEADILLPIVLPNGAKENFAKKAALFAPTDSFRLASIAELPWQSDERIIIEYRTANGTRASLSVRATTSISDILDRLPFGAANDMRILKKVTKGYVQIGTMERIPTGWVKVFGMEGNVPAVVETGVPEPAAVAAEKAAERLITFVGGANHTAYPSEQDVKTTLAESLGIDASYIVVQAITPTDYAISIDAPSLVFSGNVIQRDKGVRFFHIDTIAIPAAFRKNGETATRFRAIEGIIRSLFSVDRAEAVNQPTSDAAKNFWKSVGFAPQTNSALNQTYKKDYRTVSATSLYAFDQGFVLFMKMTDAIGAFFGRLMQSIGIGNSTGTPSDATTDIVLYGTTIKSLSKQDREQLWASGKEIHSDRGRVYEIPGQKVYQDKETYFHFRTKEELTLQLRLMVQLTKKGFFPPSTEWFYYQMDNGEYSIAAIMPFLQNTAALAKPDRRDSVAAITEPIQRVFPSFRLDFKKTDADYDDQLIWAGMIAADALKRDNWKDDTQRIYLIDIEGVNNHAENVKSVLEKIDAIYDENRTPLPTPGLNVNIRQPVWNFLRTSPESDTPRVTIQKGTPIQSRENDRRMSYTFSNARIIGAPMRRETRISMVAPLASEYGTNAIYRFLESLAAQTAPAEQFEVMLLVNHGASAAGSDVERDNALTMLLASYLTGAITVEDLNDQLIGQGAGELSTYQRNVLRKVREKQLIIHVIDYRGIEDEPDSATGGKRVNLGVIRDAGVREATRRFADNGRGGKGIIAQMDTDVLIDAHYIERIIAKYDQDPDLGALFIGMTEHFSQSVEQIAANYKDFVITRSSRPIYDIMQNIVKNRGGGNVSIGSPQIITTVAEITAAGGMPHKPRNEDFSLARNLIERGNYEIDPEILVSAEFRFRPDLGGDGAITNERTSPRTGVEGIIALHLMALYGQGQAPTREQVIALLQGYFDPGSNIPGVLADDVIRRFARDGEKGFVENVLSSLLINGVQYGSIAQDKIAERFVREIIPLLGERGSWFAEMTDARVSQNLSFHQRNRDEWRTVIARYYDQQGVRQPFDVFVAGFAQVAESVRMNPWLRDRVQQMLETQPSVEQALAEIEKQPWASAIFLDRDTAMMIGRLQAIERLAGAALRDGNDFPGLGKWMPARTTVVQRGTWWQRVLDAVQQWWSDRQVMYIVEPNQARVWSAASIAVNRARIWVHLRQAGAGDMSDSYFTKLDAANNVGQAYENGVKVAAALRSELPNDAKALRTIITSIIESDHDANIVLDRLPEAITAYKNAVDTVIESENPVYYLDVFIPAIITSGFTGSDVTQMERLVRLATQISGENKSIYFSKDIIATLLVRAQIPGYLDAMERLSEKWANYQRDILKSSDPRDIAQLELDQFPSKESVEAAIVILDAAEGIRLVDGAPLFTVLEVSRMFTKLFEESIRQKTQEIVTRLLSYREQYGKSSNFAAIILMTAHANSSLPLLEDIANSIPDILSLWPEGAPVKAIFSSIYPSDSDIQNMKFTQRLAIARAMERKGVSAEETDALISQLRLHAQAWEVTPALPGWIDQSPATTSQLVDILAFAFKRGMLDDLEPALRTMPELLTLASKIRFEEQDAEFGIKTIYPWLYESSSNEKYRDIIRGMLEAFAEYPMAKRSNVFEFFTMFGAYSQARPRDAEFIAGYIRLGKLLGEMRPVSLSTWLIELEKLPQGMQNATRAVDLLLQANIPPKQIRDALFERRYGQENAYTSYVWDAELTKRIAHILTNVKPSTFLWNLVFTRPVTPEMLAILEVYAEGDTDITMIEEVIKFAFDKGYNKIPVGNGIALVPNPILEHAPKLAKALQDKKIWAKGMFEVLGQEQNVELLKKPGNMESLSRVLQNYATQHIFEGDLTRTIAIIDKQQRIFALPIQFHEGDLGQIMSLLENSTDLAASAARIEAFLMAMADENGAYPPIPAYVWKSLGVHNALSSANAADMALLRELLYGELVGSPGEFRFIASHLNDVRAERQVNGTLQAAVLRAMVVYGTEDSFRDLAGVVADRTDFPEEALSRTTPRMRMLWDGYRRHPELRSFITLVGTSVFVEPGDFDMWKDFVINLKSPQGEMKGKLGAALSAAIGLGDSYAESIAQGIVGNIAKVQLDNLKEKLKDPSYQQVSEDNWMALFTAVAMIHDAEEAPEYEYEDEDFKRVEALSRDKELRDMVMRRLAGAWQEYLNNPESLPIELAYFPTLIDAAGGVAFYSQIEAVSGFIGAFTVLMEDHAFAADTRVTLLAGMRAIERRMMQEKWDEDAKSEFYTISADVMSAAPRLYGDFLTLFGSMSAKELKRFAKEVYPLYKAKLALSETYTPEGVQEIDRRAVVEMRQAVRQLRAQLASGEDKIAEHRKTILHDIQRMFTSKFGILRAPESFSDEQTRSIVNMSLYLAFLRTDTHSSVNPEQAKALIGYYLALMINGDWQSFRTGKAHDPAAYLTPEMVSLVRPILASRNDQFPVSAADFGISEREYELVLSVLQEEESLQRIGNIMTVDYKLTDIIASLSRLQDPDAYVTAEDKLLIQLLNRYPIALINKTVTALIQQSLRGSTNIVFSPEELELRSHIEASIREILTALNLPDDSESLAKVFQSDMKPLATIAGMDQLMRDLDATGRITALRNALTPSSEIVAIFAELGEEFQTDSGAYALTEDLERLQDIADKHADALGSDRYRLANEYLANARAEIVKTQDVYRKLSERYQGFALKKQIQDAGSDVMSKRFEKLMPILEYMDEVFDSGTNNRIFTTTFTTNINDVAENMRECLAMNSSCGSGINNDTDLTLGDPTVFFVVSKVKKQVRGSITDQLVYLLPVTYQDGSKGVAFVLDKPYGSVTRDVLENHILVLQKKVEQIQKKVPNARVSIIVPDSTLSTSKTDAAAISVTLMADNDQRIVAREEKNVTVDIRPSVFGDRYIEFVDIAYGRIKGSHKVSGLLVQHVSQQLTQVEEIAQEWIDEQTDGCDGGITFFLVSRVYAADGGRGCSIIGRILKQTGMTGEMPNRVVIRQLINSSYVKGLTAYWSLRMADLFFTGWNMLNSPNAISREGSQDIVAEIQQYGPTGWMVRDGIRRTLEVVLVDLIRRILPENSKASEVYEWFAGVISRGLSFYILPGPISNLRGIGNTLGYPWLVRIPEIFMPFFGDQHGLISTSRLLTNIAISAVLPPYPSFVYSSRIYKLAYENASQIGLWIGRNWQSALDRIFQSKKIELPVETQRHVRIDETTEEVSRRQESLEDESRLPLPTPANSSVKVLKREVAVQQSTLDTLATRVRQQPNEEFLAYILRKGIDEVIVYVGIGSQVRVVASEQEKINALRPYVTQGYTIVADYHNHPIASNASYQAADFPIEYVMSPSPGDMLLNPPEIVNTALGQQATPRIIASYLPDQDVVKVSAIYVKREPAKADTDRIVFSDPLFVGKKPTNPLIKVVGVEFGDAAMQIARGLIEPVDIVVNNGEERTVLANPFTLESQLLALEAHKKVWEKELEQGSTIFRQSPIQEYIQEISDRIETITKELSTQKVSDQPAEEKPTSFINKDCFSANPFVSRVYAADGESGNTCSPFFRAPWRVVWDWISGVPANGTKKSNTPSDVRSSISRIRAMISQLDALQQENNWSNVEGLITYLQDKNISIYEMFDDNRTTVGFSIVENTQGGEGVVWLLVVHPDKQRNGIGTRLMKIVQQDYSVLSLNPIPLGMEGDEDTPAWRSAQQSLIDLYRSLGFRFDATRLSWVWSAISDDTQDQLPESVTEPVNNDTQNQPQEQVKIRADEQTVVEDSLRAVITDQMITDARDQALETDRTLEGERLVDAMIPLLEQMQEYQVLVERIPDGLNADSYLRALRALLAETINASPETIQQTNRQRQPNELSDAAPVTIPIIGRVVNAFTAAVDRQPRMFRDLTAFVASIIGYFRGEQIQNLSFIEGAYPGFVERLGSIPFFGTLLTQDPNFWRWGFQSFVVGISIPALLSLLGQSLLSGRLSVLLRSGVTEGRESALKQLQALSTWRKYVAVAALPFLVLAEQLWSPGRFSWQDVGISTLGALTYWLAETGFQWVRTGGLARLLRTLSPILRWTRSPEVLKDGTLTARDILTSEEKPFLEDLFTMGKRLSRYFFSGPLLISAAAAGLGRLLYVIGENLQLYTKQEFEQFLAAYATFLGGIPNRIIDGTFYFWQLSDFGGALMSLGVFSVGFEVLFKTVRFMGGSIPVLARRIASGTSIGLTVATLALFEWAKASGLGFAFSPEWIISSGQQFIAELLANPLPVMLTVFADAADWTQYVAAIVTYISAPRVFAALTNREGYFGKGISAVRKWISARKAAVAKIIIFGAFFTIGVASPQIPVADTVEQVVGVIQEADDRGCFSANPFVSRVYAADVADSADELFEGNTCPLFLRPPMYVLKQLWKYRGTVGKILTFDAFIRLGLGAYPYITKGLVLPAYTELPPPLEPGFCTYGGCTNGCATGFRCSETSGCCEPQEGYADSICSAEGNAEIRRVLSGSLYDSTETVGCDERGCADGKCIGYDSEQKDAPLCSTLPPDEDWQVLGFEDDIYLPAQSCRNAEGEIEWRLGILTSAKGDYACSEDRKAIVSATTGEAIWQCGEFTECDALDGNSNCIPKWFLADYMWSSECNPLQTRNDGFVCTREGLRCTPGQTLPKTNDIRCDRVCEDGTSENTPVKWPIDCAPYNSDYADYRCVQSESGQAAVQYKNPVVGDDIRMTECGTNKCIYGACAGSVGETCTDYQEGSTLMKEDGSCLLTCRDGKYEETSVCGKDIKILSYNNIGRQKILEALSLLPDHILEDAHYNTLRHLWYPRVNSTGHTAVGTAYSIIDLANTNTMDYGFAGQTAEVVIHEYMHEWATTQAAWYPHNWPLADILNVAPLVTNFSQQGIAPAPADYMKTIGCKKEDGKFSYGYQPVTGYSGLPVDEVECGEDFADSAAWYVTRACDLLTGGESGDYEAGQVRYDYFKDTIFEGREYLPPGGCGKGG